uniref:Uncharacterized protein n=1 Tax=Panagrolaimus sp. ES5 TaxID=591445 RepID=A0AC34GUD3_9BILA
MKSNEMYPKLWPCGKFLAACGEIQLSKFIVKFSKFDLKYLRLYEQKLSWEDYQILTSSGSLERLELVSSEVRYSDGTIFTVEKLLQNLHQLKILKLEDYHAEIFETDTIKNLVAILPKCKHLRGLHFLNLTETFDFLSFKGYILANENVNIVLKYKYTVPLSFGYVQMLNNFIDKILKNPPKKIPDINYLDLDNDRYREYQKLRRGFT